MSKKLTRLQIEKIVHNMLMKQLLEGSGDRNDKDREQGHGKQRQRVASDGSKGDLEEIFHACASHVKENRPGREGRPINHTLLENGTVTHYDVEFVNEIVTGIPVSELTVLKEEGHLHAPKRDDKPHGDKPRRRLDELGDEATGPSNPARPPRAADLPAAENPTPTPPPQDPGHHRPVRSPAPPPSREQSTVHVRENLSDKTWYEGSLYNRLLKEWTKK